MKRTDLIAAVVLAALLSTAATAEAGWPRRSGRHVVTSECRWAVNHYLAEWRPVAIPRPQAMTQAETQPRVVAHYQTAQQPATQQQAGQVAVQRVSYAATATVEYGDAYGFTAWINGVRARYGLRALAWSADAAAHAAINSARGFGHSYLGGTRRQNVGMGPLGQVEQGWLSSPGHFSAIVDPSVTEVGLAYVGGVWTMNAR